MRNRKILITGVAGFIGYHLCKRLLEFDYEIIGVDCLNNYYDTKLKLSRLENLRYIEGQVTSEDITRFTFLSKDISNTSEVESLFLEHEFDIVINFAAQAGVRYSIENPQEYIKSNIQGFMNILEACRYSKPMHLIFASSSSVYGMNTKMPFATFDHTDHPMSLYAATKKSNELMAHSYSHLYKIPSTGLRFFTVYGPWGRPDMAYFSFTRKILNGEPIQVFNNGQLLRDFTYIDDVVSGILGLLEKAPPANDFFNSELPNPSISSAPYRLFNVGNNNPIKLLDFLAILESKIGRHANIEFKDMQPGDVYSTYAEISDLTSVTGFKPLTSIDLGLEKFVSWYKEYYGV